MKNVLRVGLAAGAVILGAATTANAAGISIFSVNGNVYQNTLNNPCLFDGNGNPCTVPAGFPPPQDSTQTFDPNPLTNTIEGSEFTAWQTWVGSSFLLGLDVNEANSAPQSLSNLTISFFNGATQLGTTLSFEPVPVSVPNNGNNGTGWADYVFAAGCAQFTNGFCTSLTPFVLPANTNRIVFTFGMNVFNDGPDRLFAIQADGNEPCDPAVCSPVPEPASLLLLGGGLLGAAVAVRRRRRA